MLRSPVPSVGVSGGAEPWRRCTLLGRAVHLAWPRKQLWQCAVWHLMLQAGCCVHVLSRWRTAAACLMGSDSSQAPQLSATCSSGSKFVLIVERCRAVPLHTPC
mmetsp:Transcript_44635/g.95238  ORF Transcript_44635/g.95238 Transcript_44635/m.95238 type:complete len:104 (+) Transcript_44635:663-974(+)